MVAEYLQNPPPPPPTSQYQTDSLILAASSLAFYVTWVRDDESSPYYAQQTKKCIWMHSTLNQCWFSAGHRLRRWASIKPALARFSLYI